MTIQELESEYYAGLQRGEYDAGLRERIERMKIEEEIKEYAEMRDSGEAEDMREEIDGIIARLKERLDGNPHSKEVSADAIGAFVTVRAGAGGTEAQDWASMLVHMYERFASRRKCRIKYTDISVGEVAGVKSATLRIEGKDIFDKLKNESGVHRLVRISPYNAQGKRQTSFASVEVIPLLEEKDNEMEISDADLGWEFFRSGGPGGQYQNTTDSGARVRHLPTGIVVESRQERSQYQNKRICLEKLRSELKMREDEKLREFLEQFASRDPNGWGHAFRSYVLEPYKMVNDERLRVKSGKVEKVLDGALNILYEKKKGLTNKELCQLEYTLKRGGN